MKSFTKIAAVVISAVLAASAFGCGSSDAAGGSNPGFQPQNIQVNEAGFSITNEGNLRYAFVAVNPNDGYIAEGVTFTIEAYDAKGSMIAGSSDSIAALYPGAETAAAGETELFSPNADVPEVSNLSIVALSGSINWTPTTITKDDLDESIHIVEPHKGDTVDGALEIMADLNLAEGDSMKLDSSKPIELRAVALLFDASGRAICGTAVSTFKLDSDNSSYEFAEIIENPPKYSECVLYVTPTE